MPKKAAPTPSVPPTPHPQVDPETAPHIWLAGLGAFAKAQQQGGKVFEALVQDGLAMQRKTQEAARAQMSEATQKLSAMAGGLGSRAGQQWDRLEGIFEERVARALQRLNMASGEELQALRERVDALEARLARAGKAKAAPSASAQAAAARKTSTPKKRPSATTRTPRAQRQD